MTDILEILRDGGPCLERGEKCRAMEAKGGCDCAIAADEIERLRAALAEAVTRLKLLYMAAGLGQTKGLDALKELSEITSAMSAALLYQQKRETK